MDLNDVEEAVQIMANERAADLIVTRLAVIAEDINKRIATVHDGLDRRIMAIIDRLESLEGCEEHGIDAAYVVRTMNRVIALEERVVDMEGGFDDYGYEQFDRPVPYTLAQARRDDDLEEQSFWAWAEVDMRWTDEHYLPSLYWIHNHWSQERKHSRVGRRSAVQDWQDWIDGKLAETLDGPT